MTLSSGSSVRVDGSAVLARVAGLLADAGPDALPRALAAAVDGLALHSAVLRDAGSGAVLAVAGDVVHAVPPTRTGSQLHRVLELPVHGAGRQLASLTVVGSTPAQLPLVRACAAVLGLALAADVRTDDRLPTALLAAADADADAVADALHDGPMQELVFARLAADAAVRGGDAAGARDAVQAAVQSLRRTLWMLRPRGRGPAGLAEALPELSDRLRESSRPTLRLHLDTDACAALAPQAASVAYRLVQAAALASGSAVAVRVTRRDELVAVEVEVDGDVAAAGLADRWSARARALGGRLDLEPTGRLVLSLPVRRTDLPDPDDTEAIL